MQAAVHLPDSAVLPPAQRAAVVREVAPARPLVTRLTSASAQKSYTIVSGDTLSGIAGRDCGNPRVWPGVWQQNKASIPNPDLIYPGQKLTFTCEDLTTVPAADPPADPPASSQATPAAQDAPVQAAAAPGAAAVTGVTGGTLTFAGLEALWEAAGGPAWAAAAAAAVAECESGGQQNAYNPSGASGYWQILGQVVGGNVFDPLVNAENAVSKFEASGDTWAQWVCQP